MCIRDRFEPIWFWKMDSAFHVLQSDCPHESLFRSLLRAMVVGMNGILYAQPIADVISVVITLLMALHLHRELSIAEKQVMSNSEM